jgi:3-methyladenine DNA glycosylase/8-oxoguanine DNA glycosylase
VITEEVVRVEVRPPWAFSLPLRNGLDGLTRARRGVLERLLHHGDEPVHIRVAQPSRDRVVFVSRGPQRDAAEWGVERMRLSLGVDQDLRPFHERFQFDPLIGRAVRSNPGLRAPGRPEPFEALAWAICEQLIEFERAAAIERRMTWKLGRRCLQTGLRDSPPAAVLADQAPLCWRLLTCRRAGRARWCARPARCPAAASTSATPTTSGRGGGCGRSVASAAGRFRCLR